MPEPHVLLLDHTGDLGGAERVLVELVAGMATHGMRASVACCPEGPLAERVAEAGAAVWPLALEVGTREVSREDWATRPLAVAWQAREILGEALRLARRARAEGVTLLHTNTLKAHVLGSLVGALARLPVVWHLHDLPGERGDTRRLLAWAARVWRPAAIVAVSRAAADDLPPGLQPLARVVHNGLSLPAFDARASAPLGPEALPAGAGSVIGGVSWLIPWKGYDVLLRALPRVLATRPDVRLAIVGDPIFQWRDERRRLEALAAELGVSHHVAFLGAREDVPALLAAFDVFVHPARREPFGRVLLEAMAARKAVVACEAGGVPEIVQAGETGLLVPVDAPEALAEALLTLLADPKRAQAMGEAGRQRVAAAFTLEAFVDGVIATWRQAAR